MCYSRRARAIVMNIGGFRTPGNESLYAVAQLLGEKSIVRTWRFGDRLQECVDIRQFLIG